MSAVFEELKVADVCQVGDGAHASIKRQEEGVLYLSSRNFKEGKLDLSKVYFISEEDFAKHFRSSSKAITRPEPGDVVLSIIGSIGEPYIVKATDRFGLSSAVAILRPLDSEEVSPDYLYYWIKSPEFQQAIYAIKGGVAQGYVSLEMIRSLPVRKFVKSKQRKIAEILNVYDNLIENNNRRIAILEEMAQSLYREWFINFRFPGHENAKFVNSPLGKIPEGWEVKNIADISQYINRGIAPKYNDGCADKVINQKCIRNFRIDMSLARNHERKAPAEKSVQFGDVLINSTGVGTLGRVAQVLVKCSNVTVDTHVTIVRAMAGLPVEYWGCMLENLQEHFERLGEGATGQTELKRQLIGETKIVFPGARLAKEFSSLVMPIRSMIPVLLSKNENLKSQRDMLLPRLISGAINLS